LEIGLIGSGIAIVLLVLTMFRYTVVALQARESPIVQFGFWMSLLGIIGNMSGAVLLESGLGKALCWLLLVYIYLMASNLPTFGMRKT